MLATMLATMLCLAGSALDESRSWHNSYTKALEEVQRTDKPLFVVFEPGSAVMSRWMTGRGFMTGPVKQRITADYVPLYVDPYTPSGKKIASLFEIDGLPRIVVIDRTGDWQVYRRSGEHKADEVLAVLTQYRRSRLTSEGLAAFGSLPASSTGSGAAVRECRT